MSQNEKIRVGDTVFINEYSDRPPTLHPTKESAELNAVNRPSITVGMPFLRAPQQVKQPIVIASEEVLDLKKIKTIKDVVAVLGFLGLVVQKVEGETTVIDKYLKLKEA